MPEVVIAVEEPRSEDVRALLAAHLGWAAQHSPPEDVHALDGEGLQDPSLMLFTARRDGVLLGTGALQVAGGNAEIKSMHTAEHARGQGVGASILARLLATARDLGCSRVSLETGSMDAFAPARRLYESAGFTYTDPFGSYEPSAYSSFMTLTLDRG